MSSSTSARRPGLMTRSSLLLVRAYQAVPRAGAPRCRFAPTCSSYAREALATHGALRGWWLSVRRLGRCHPFHPGGLDPVPPPEPAPHARQGALS